MPVFISTTPNTRTATISINAALIGLNNCFSARYAAGKSNNMENAGADQ